jgi:hypothetical protein
VTIDYQSGKVVAGMAALVATMSAAIAPVAVAVESTSKATLFAACQGFVDGL